MAVKVNVNFVVGLGSALVLVIVVGVVAANRFVYKSATQHAAAGAAAETKAQQTQAALDAARQAVEKARTAGDQPAVKAAEEAAAGALAAANKDWEAAAEAYGKAVNKERTNIEYLKKWLGALSKMTPQPAELYRDVYQKKWLAAQRSLAEAAPGNLDIQRNFMNLILDDLRLRGSTPSAWEQMIQTTDAALKGFTAEDKGASVLRRFRGIARVQAMGLVHETPQEKAMQAKADLEAALAVDPDDGDAAASLGHWYRQMSSMSRQIGAGPDAEKYDADGLEFLRKFVADRQDIAPVLFVLTQAELNEAARVLQKKTVTSAEEAAAREKEFAVTQKEMVSKMIDRVMTVPPAKIDRYTAFEYAATALAASIDKAHDRAVAVLDRSMETRPNDVFLIFKKGEIEMAAANEPQAAPPPPPPPVTPASDPANPPAAAPAAAAPAAPAVPPAPKALTQSEMMDGAIKRLQALVDLPDLPLSQDGMLLFGLREEALARQSECALAIWQNAQARAAYAEQVRNAAVANQSAAEARSSTGTEEERKAAADEATTAKDTVAKAEELKKTAAADGVAALDRAKGYRDRLAQQVGETNLRVLFLDGKLAYARPNGLADARRLLGMYNDQTNPPRSDINGLKLLADVLRRLDNLPGAQSELEAVVSLNPFDVEAKFTLAGVLAQMGSEANLRDAKKQYEEILRVQAGNVRAQELLARVTDVLKGKESKDPVVKALSDVKEKMDQSPADVQGAREVIRAAVNGITEWDANTALRLAPGAVQLDDRDLAKEIIAKGLESQQAKSNPAAAEALKNFIKRLENPDPLEAIKDLPEPPYFEYIKCMLRAQVYRRLGQVDSAKAEVAKAKALSPDDPLVVSGGFDHALADGDMAEAKRLSEVGTANNMDKMNGLVFKARLAQKEAQLAMEGKRQADYTRKMSEAQSLAQQAVEKDQLNPMCWRLLGAVRSQGGLFKEAIAAFEKSQGLKHDDHETTKALIRCYVAAGLYAQALDAARQLVQSSNVDYESADMWLDLEGTYGETDKAINKRAQQFRSTPKDRLNALKLAELYLKVKKFDDAKPVIEAVAAQKVDLPSLQLQAQYYSATGNKECAVSAFEEYIASRSEAEQKDVLLWFEYGRFVAQQMKDVKEGIKILERARKLQTKDEMEVDREIGDMAFGAGDFETSSDAYQRALDSVKSDDRHRLRFRIIEGRLRQGKFDEADRLCSAAEQAGVKDEIQLFLLRSECRLALKDRSGAAVYLDAAVKLDPKSALAFYKRGQLRVTDPNQVSDGIGDLKQAVRLDPLFYEARKLLATTLFGTGQPQACIDLLKEGVAADPAHGPMWNDLVIAYYTSGDTRNAMQTLDEAMKRFNNPIWLVMAAELNTKEANYPKAAEFYTRAVKAGLKTPQVVRPYCDALLRLPRPATEEVKQVLSDPEVNTEQYGTLLMVRARALWLERRQSDAINDIKKAFTMVDLKKSVEVNAFFQELLLIATKAGEALSLVDQFRPPDGFPDSVKFQIVLIKLGDQAMVRDGLKELDDLIARNKDGPDRAELIQALRYLGDIMFAQRRYEIAAEVYRRAMVVAPEDSGPVNNLAYVVGKFLNKPEEALPLAEKAALLAPNDANVVDTLGTMHLLLKHAEEAEKLFKRALDLAPQPMQKVPIMLHLVEVKLLMKDRAKADGYMDQMNREILKDPKTEKIFAPEIDRVRKQMLGN